MWKNKVVIVTGGSGGLGQAIGMQFARAGSRVILVARDWERLEIAAAMIRGNCSDVELRLLCCDVTNQDDVDFLFRKVAEEFGSVDVLVNNAGRSVRGRVVDTTPEQFQLLFDLNVLGVVRCTRGALPFLLQSRGHIVNIGSLASKSAAKFVGAYPVTKFAVAAYSQQLRLELSDDGVHVLLVCPGPIKRGGERLYEFDDTANVPESAMRQGAGVNVGLIEPIKLADKIIKYCELRKPELIVPAKAKLLFAISQISPTLGDWIVKQSTK
ncbi:MAG: SDR family NAD(P)-dependent oxidoreductase [Planctomycetaceae bacterium]|jgi:short-subunit dehydrogenase|nr:SDR family NAD(P)-dependent oxidoreductase [Planctomycetaceae bacterium]